MSSFCVPEVYHLDFIIKSDIFNIDEFSKAILVLKDKTNNQIIENERLNYINAIKPGFFFDNLFSLEKRFHQSKVKN